MTPVVLTGKAEGTTVHLRTCVASLAVLASLSLAGPSAAQETRTLTGPGSPSTELFMTFVGCAAFDSAATPPRSRLNLGPGTPPLGRRSLGLVPQGPGTAAGPYAEFSSLSSLDVVVPAASTRGTSGVSYIWALTAATPPGTAWHGRAELSVPAGGWHDVRPGELAYAWTLVQLGSGEVVARGETGTPADLAAAHGDGAGYVVTGFGCDGTPFNLDAVRAGALTHDYEGVALATRIATSTSRTAAGEAVGVTGTVADPGGRVTGDPLQLQVRTAGGAWRDVGEPVLPGEQGASTTEVVLEETSELRWHRPQSQYADEGWSDAVTVTVLRPEPAEPTAGTGAPSERAGGKGPGGAAQGQGRQ